uniref:Protein krueppel n=1 Tax=Anopheles maculatus TaxID=74869 RepID=A0A182SHK5_9DIPT
MDLSEICRVCVEEVNNFWYLFESCIKLPPELTPALIIAACADIEIDQNDGLPESVCDSCLQAMVAAYQIREKCISSDRKLRKILLHNKASNVQRATSEEIKIEHKPCKIEIVQPTEATDETEAYRSVDEYDDSSDSAATDPENDGAAVALQEALLQSESCDEEYLFNDSLEQLEDDAEIELVEDYTPDAEVPLANDVSDKMSTVEPIQDPESPNEPETGDCSKKFTCDICEKRFTTKGNLKAHVHLHNNIKPYRCEVCGDEFSRKHNYNVHKIRHTGERTHKCPVCDKSFVCSVNLKNHMVMHSDVKPYNCQTG